jgi:hypothetical protein
MSTSINFSGGGEAGPFYDFLSVPIKTALADARRAQLSLDIGLRRVRVLSNNPVKVRALEQSGLEVVERVALGLHPRA